MDTCAEPVEVFDILSNVLFPRVAFKHMKSNDVIGTSTTAQGRLIIANISTPRLTLGAGISTSAH